MAKNIQPKYSVGNVDGPNESGFFTAAVDFDGDKKREPHGGIVETHDTDRGRALQRASLICYRLNKLTIDGHDV